MAVAHPKTAELSESDRQLLESWLVEFDESWHSERLAERVRELPPPWTPLRLSALAEMVKIDLERQWQRGRRVAIESYLKTYPELGTPKTVTADLIQAEYEVRRQFGVPADIVYFATRFPQQAADLRHLLARSAEETSRPQPGDPQRSTDSQRLNATSDGHGRKVSDQLPREFGRYRIIERLGEGGMGSVYLAHDTQLDRQVALKVPHFRPEEGPEMVERFYREARAAAALEHPNLCPVHDVGEIDGIPYLTMAYIDGQALSEFIDPEKPLPQRQVAAAVRKLAVALQEAHAHGVVHRDLKPANVMINKRRQPVIMDFGLARQVKRGEARLTQSGAVMGSPAYMSPEQVEGDLEAMGPGCDIYSLGVMLYELLTGRLPFEGSAASVMGQILATEPSPPSQHRADADPRLEAICLKAMAKKAEDRYGSMQDMADALAEFLRSGESQRTGDVLGVAKQRLPGSRESSEETLAARFFAQLATSEGAQSVLSRLRGRKRVSWQRFSVWTWIAVAGMMAAMLLLAVVISVVTDKGTVKIEFADSIAAQDYVVHIDDQEIRIEKLGRPITLRPGEHYLVVKRDDVVVHTRNFKVVKGKNKLLQITFDPLPIPIWDGRVHDTKAGKSWPARILVEVSGEHLNHCNEQLFDDLDVSWMHYDKPLADEALQNADILIVSHPSKGKSYSETEREAVRRFVERGGGLLIGGIAWLGKGGQGYEESDYPPNQLAGLFGMTMKAVYAGDPARFADHPITRRLANVEQVEGIKLGTNSPIELTSPSRALIWDRDEKVVYATSSRAKGRVCFMPSNHLARPELLQKSAEYVTLNRQILEWLAPRETSGTVPGAVIGSPSRNEAANWPVVFEDPLTDPASPARFHFSKGQYGGHVVVDSEQALSIGSSHTTSALWVKTPVSDRYEFSFEVRLLEHWSLYVWGSGPGHGNADGVGYCFKLDQKKGKGSLCREGEEISEFPMPEGLASQEFHRIRLLRHGARLVFSVDNRVLVDSEDLAPLSGALCSRVGFGSKGGRAGLGPDALMVCRNVVLRRPALSREEESVLATVPLSPEATVPPAENRETLFEATAADMVGERWFHSQPDDSSVHEGNKLVLSGFNGKPTVMHTAPITGDFAFEVSFEYVAPVFPRPPLDPGKSYGENWLRAGGEELNLHMVVSYAKQFPGPEEFVDFVKDRPTGWEVALPHGDGTHVVRWTEGRDQQDIAENPHYAPIGGRKYTARLERHGEAVRLFLDGALLLSADQPVQLVGPDMPAFLGVYQYYGGSIIHKASAYRIESDAPAALESMATQEGDEFPTTRSGDVSRPSAAAAETPVTNGPQSSEQRPHNWADVPKEFSACELLVHVETGARVDVKAIVKDKVMFPGAKVRDGNLLFEVPHSVFDDLFKDLRRRRAASRSGIDPIPKDVRFLVSISPDGVFDCGIFSEFAAHSLGAFILDSVVRFDKRNAFNYEFTVSNDLTFERERISSMPADRYRNVYTTLDVRQSGAATVIAYYYWVCALRQWLTEGPADFRELYDVSWWVRNDLGSHVSLLKSCLVFRCLDHVKDSAPYAYSLWCPARKGTSGARIQSFRTFDLEYTNQKATAFLLKAANDNSVTCQVWLDDALLVNETQVGSYLGRKLRYDARPKRVRLVVDRPWSANGAYVVVAQLGGELQATNCHENVNGVDNPAGTYDENPSPFFLRIPTGWSEWRASSRQ